MLQGLTDRVAGPAVVELVGMTALFLCVASKKAVPTPIRDERLVLTN